MEPEPVASARARLRAIMDPAVPSFYRRQAERAAEHSLSAARFACSNANRCPSARLTDNGLVGGRVEFFAVLYFRRRHKLTAAARLEPRVVLLCRACAQQFVRKHRPEQRGAYP